MSIQWTLIAAFLYAEIFLVLLLVLPLASPQRWQKIFKSRFLNALSNQAQFYFLILLAILVLFFLDAIREMRKYSNPDEATHQHLDAEMQVNMRLFRSQRNFYISGFALFLSLVIRRLVTLISKQAELLAESAAALKQAQSAASAARSLMSQTQSSAAQNDANEAHDQEVKKLRERIRALEGELSFEKKDKEALKAQAAAVGTEYDRLAEEHRRLQEQETAGDPHTTKKDN